MFTTNIIISYSLFLAWTSINNVITWEMNSSKFFWLHFQLMRLFYFYFFTIFLPLLALLRPMKIKIPHFMMDEVIFKKFLLIFFWFHQYHTNEEMAWRETFFKVWVDKILEIYQFSICYARLKRICEYTFFFFRVF